MKSLLIVMSIIVCGSLSLVAKASETLQHSDSQANADTAEQQPLYNQEYNEEHNQEHDHKDEHEHGHEEGVTEIDDAMAQQVGIVVARTGAQTLHQTFTSYGRLTTSPEHNSHVRARFPGIVRSVVVNIGDQVSTGDLLAVIESNESLKRYDVRAPIDGTVIQRHANAGEMTQDQVLFSISSFESLWAELRIFPSQQRSLNVGQPVYIKAGDKRFESHISHLLPAEDASPNLIARAKISGEQDGWFPGLMVEGEVVINTFETSLAVSKSAIQTIGGVIGIFVKEHDTYRFTPLLLGRSDSEFAEVLSGVTADVEYVTQNSYLVKADIEKSEAEHEH